VYQVFYDEYFAGARPHRRVLSRDHLAVFQQHLLPKGELVVHNRRVDSRAIRKTMLLTVEGERDDVCARLARRWPPTRSARASTPTRKAPTTCSAGVGHYGVFSGRQVADADLPDGPQQ
jgi:poly-beta-hydroxyalkanoate depolymerase